MKHLNPFLSLLTVITMLACGSKSNQKRNTSTAHLKEGKIVLSGGWARPGLKRGNSAAYLTIHNNTNTTDTLLNITANAAEEAAMHETYQKNDMVGMRPTGPKAIKPDSSLKLSPGAYHIMLIRLKKLLAKGDSINLTLHFTQTGKHELTIPVKLQP